MTVGRAAEQGRHTLEAQVAGLGPLPPADDSPQPAGPFRTDRAHLILIELVGAQPGAVFALRAPSMAIGRSADAEVSLGDATVSAEHARITTSHEGVHIEDVDSLNGTFVNGRRIHARTRLADGDYLRLGARSVLKFSMMDDLEERAHRTLFELTLRDPLTRLYNRRYFDERLLSEFGFAKRHHTELAILLLDIDHFKHFNDAWGHQVGDVVLKLVANSIQSMMRPEDVLARYGGEEFVVLARATSARNMEILGERLCRRVAALQLDLPPPAVAVTVSIGASHMSVDTPSSCAEALLRAADLALFAAKSGGRNRTASAVR
jgi:two-component system, cell cycle response regulator